MFTKSEMLDELRTILLFQADNILLGSGEERARHFIGFPVGRTREYCFESPSLVELADRPIASAFDAGYDYAFRPSFLNVFDEHQVQDLHVFMLGTPRAGGILSGGETHRFMTPDGLCQIVADTVLARWKLEWAGGDHHNVHQFTPRELALLANMTEGAVRNATADKSQNGLKAIPGTKNPILFRGDEAWRWLSSRRGFIPSPNTLKEDRFFSEHLRELPTSADLGKLIERRLKLSSAPLRQRLGWTEQQINSWCDGSFKFDQKSAHLLAETLDVDVPLFVGKALELSLRRDGGKA